MRALLAEAYSSAGEWEKALDAYKKALEEPANQEPEMQTRLSMGLGMTALKLELPEMAVAALQEAAQAEPLNGQIQRSLSEAYYTNGLSQDAFQAAAAALQLAPKDIDMLSWFIDQGTRIAGLPGAAQHSIQEDVIQALRSALQQAPERADLLIRLGSLLFQSDRKADAIEVFRKLASVDTFTQKVSLRAIYKAGLEVLGAGDARLAVVLLRKAIAHLEDQDERVEPGKEGISLAELYEALVRALEVLGDLDGALESIEQALKLDQARAALYSTKAEILLKLGDTENARQTLEIALARWPENVSLYQKMARLLRAMGDLPSALLQVEKGIAVVEESEEAVSGTDLFFLASRLAYATLRPRRAFAYLQKALPADDPDFNRFDNAIFRAELALESGEEQAAAQAVELFDAEAADSARALAASGRIGLRIGDREGGEKKCRSAVRMWTRLQKDQPGQTPATNIDDYLSELASMGMAALETRQWEQALSIFHQMVLMFPDEPQANIKYAQALAVCAEAQALCEDFEVVKNAPGKSSLLDPASQKFEESLRKAALKAGIGDILTSDGILEGKDVEIQRSIGLWVKRGRACFRPTMENAASLEFLLQSIMPGTDDVAALVMVYRRCGAKDRAKKSAIVGWQPVFEGRDPRTDPQVLAQLALAEDGLQQAIETVMECIAASASRGMGWPEVPMMQFFLSKLHYQAEDYEAAWQAVQLALGVWPNEPRWKAFAAQIQLARSSSNRPQQLGEAIGLLEQAASLEPEYGSHMLELGKIYLESEQYKRALQALEQAVRLDPQNAEGWLSLAQVQHLLSDLDQAALSAEKAIELSGDQIDPLLLRAEIAVKAKNFRAAMSRSQAVLRSKPDHPQALFLLAKSLSGLDRPTVALEALEKAISLSDAPLAMQLERLDLIKRADGLEAGLKALQELVAQNPKQAAFLGLLAGWLQEAGKQDAAIQAARLALQEGLEGLSSQQRADLHTMIGLHMRKLGQLDQAIHHLSEAVSKSSDHIDAYLELGTVYQERREFQQALKIYQKAINLAGGDYRPYYHAGLVLKDNKDYMAAEAMLRRAAQLAPNEVGVHRMLGAVVALNLVHSRRLVPGETGEYKS
jgi:tetratricopeptide (TPR) repeat protein